MGFLTLVVDRRTHNFYRNYFNVIYALCLHDIKTRFFGNGLGQVVIVLWPLCHILILLLIYTFTGRTAPYGDSLLVYSSVSLMPFIIISYMARWIMMAVAQNKSFTQYPVVQILDLMFARMILEIISMFIVTLLILTILYLLGDDSLPNDYATAASGWFASIFLAFALGVLNGAMVAIFPFWMLGFMLFIIIAYAASGMLFVVSKLPASIRDFLSWNPILQCVEWMRSAYYSDYNSLVLDKAYVLRFSCICLAFGLLLERFTRRFRSA
jgi:capsular polysaccharide transport system permease protein